MSEIKRYDCTSGGAAFCQGCYQMEETELGDYVKADDHDAALTTKDARIAELEGLLRYVRESAIYDNTVQAERIDQAIAGQRQDEPVAATPSEDVGEVPEVVGHLLLGGPADHYELEDNDIDLDMKIVDRLQAELVTKGEGVILALMTVAQHSRIMAAKDAEIAHWKGKSEEIDEICQGLQEIIHNERITNRNESLANAEAHGKTIAERDELRAQLDAQPARQVGGDEREAIKEFKALGFDFGPATPDEMNKPQEIEKLVSQINAMHQQENTAAQRAALTPAAVVMPKRPGDFYLHEPGYQRGWVAHQIEIARLNRNAIPVELLERIASRIDDLETASGFACGIGDELRALLGKEEGGQ